MEGLKDVDNGFDVVEYLKRGWNGERGGKNGRTERG